MTNNKMQEGIESLMRDASAVLRERNEQELRRILVNAEAKVNLINTPINAFNLINPSDDYEITLTIPNDLYSGIAQNLSQAREQLTKLLNEVNQDNRSHISNVKITGDLSADPDWRENSGLLVTGARSYSQSEAEDLWGDGLRVFISHTHDVKRKAKQLGDDLKHEGMTTFVAHEDIYPSKEWQQEVTKALSTMQVFIALLTEQFKFSNWCGQEVGFAFAREVKIIPVRLGIDPYGFIAKSQALSCSWDEMPEKISGILMEHPQLFIAYVEKIRESRSFRRSIELSKRLPLMHRLTVEQGDELAKAVNENLQAWGSWGFNSGREENGNADIAEHLTRLTGRKYVLKNREDKPNQLFVSRFYQ